MVNTSCDVKWLRPALPKRPVEQEPVYTLNGGNRLSFRNLVVRWTISTVVVVFTRAHAPQQHVVFMFSAFKSRIWSRCFILIRFATCVMFCDNDDCCGNSSSLFRFPRHSIIEEVDHRWGYLEEIPHRYFVFLVIPLLRKWTIAGDTWSLTSIPLHADATRSITAKIHLCLLTKLRHTASSLYTVCSCYRDTV